MTQNRLNNLMFLVGGVLYGVFIAVMDILTDHAVVSTIRSYWGW